MPNTRTSAGLLMYRLDGGLRVLLVHPGGPSFRSKDEGSWSIPKGEVMPGEHMLEAAFRKFGEEIGFVPDVPFLTLTPVRQKGGKVVHAWAVQGECDPAAITSNTFTIEWPPRSGRHVEFPEIDRASYFGPEEARRKINAGQVPLIDEVERLLAGGA